MVGTFEIGYLNFNNENSHFYSVALSRLSSRRENGQMCFEK